MLKALHFIRSCRLYFSRRLGGRLRGLGGHAGVRGNPQMPQALGSELSLSLSHFSGHFLPFCTVAKVTPHWARPGGTAHSGAPTAVPVSCPAGSVLPSLNPSLSSLPPSPSHFLSAPAPHRIWTGRAVVLDAQEGGAWSWRTKALWSVGPGPACVALSLYKSTHPCVDAQLPGNGAHHR